MSLVITSVRNMLHKCNVYIISIVFFFVLTRIFFFTLIIINYKPRLKIIELPAVHFFIPNIWNGGENVV